MSHETLTLQDSPLETERLVGAAAFGNTVDMTAFETAYAVSGTEASQPGFDSLIAEPGFNSLIGTQEASTFNSLV